MTPAEREVLKLDAQKAVEEVDYNGEFESAATPEAILHLLDLISSLELTLSNATSVMEVQRERIEALEASVRDFLDYADIPREECFDDSQLGRAYALLAAPTEPTPEEGK
jgi:hypothetical protein